MIINTLKLDSNHWSTDWIPISYKLKKNQFNNSFTFLWSENDEVSAICRSYYISKSNIEIGDIWFNEKYRGKIYKNEMKYSLFFLKEVISKIWKVYPSSNNITLIVEQNNLPAIKLYKKLNFKIIKNIESKELNIKNGLYMKRIKLK